MPPSSRGGPIIGVELRFRLAGVDRDLRVAPEVVAIAGYTGRDQASVRQHVAELAEQGVAPPPQVPMVYAVTADRLTTAPSIEVSGTNTSGEAEFVLVLSNGDAYVGAGSDHTDRALERLDITAAKQCCPKVMGTQLWRLDDIDAHWDDLELRSWVGAERSLYQEGSVASLLRPADILDVVRSCTNGPLGTALVFGGTLPLLAGRFVPSTRFEVELFDPVLDRRLGCRYDIAPLRWLRGE